MKKFAISFLFLLLAIPARAQEPIPVAHRNPFASAALGIGHEVRMTFVDIKRHPYAWGLNAGLQMGIAFADTGSSCAIAQERLGGEYGPAHYFIGHHPNCRKLVLLTATSMTIHLTAEHWLMEAFTESCYREAANPDSRWWKTPAHTHNPESCRWAVPVADTLALGSYEIPVIAGNIRWLNAQPAKVKP
jgi:hypothetical protein